MRISELAEKADVSVRTIRYYIEEGLLPQPERRGPQTEYGSDYLVRLRLIQELKKAFLPLSEIRERIEQLSEDEIWQLLREAAETDELEVRVMSSRMSTISGVAESSPELSWDRSERVANEESEGREAEVNRAKSYIQKILQDRTAPAQPPIREDFAADTWKRYDLADGIELNVRGPLDGRRASLLRRVLGSLRQELRNW